MTAEFIEQLDETLEDDTLEDRYLTFLLDDEVYAMDIRYVTEIVTPQPITSVPRMPAYIKGIINLRGKIIPVIDVRLRFGKPETTYTDKTCFIVIDINEISLGLIVDQVSEVLNIPHESVIPADDFKMKFQNNFIRGIAQNNGHHTLVLDCARLIEDGELSADALI